MLFGKLRGAQEEAAKQLLSHVASSARLVPPGLTSGEVQAWRGQAGRLSGEWEAQVEAGLEALQQHAEQLDAKVRGGEWRTIGDKESDGWCMDKIAEDILLVSMRSKVPCV